MITEYCGIKNGGTNPAIVLDYVVKIFDKINDICTYFGKLTEVPIILGFGEYQ